MECDDGDSDGGDHDDERGASKLANHCGAENQYSVENMTIRVMVKKGLLMFISMHCGLSVCFIISILVNFLLLNCFDHESMLIPNNSFTAIRGLLTILEHLFQSTFGISLYQVLMKIC